MKFGTGSNAERTQKYGGSKYKMTYIRPNIYTSAVLEHKWRASLKTILFLLTSNTEATENKVKFLNLAYRVKGFQCHSNNSLQLLELKEKTTTTKQYTLFKSFLCDIL